MKIDAYENPRSNVREYHTSISYLDIKNFIGSVEQLVVHKISDQITNEVMRHIGPAISEMLQDAFKADTPETEVPR
jgi:hypothetical protein